MRLIIGHIIKKAAGEMSPQEVNSLMRKPEVAAYASELAKRKQVREKSKSWKTPLAAGLLGAGGYGMKRLGDAALSPEDRGNLESFVQLQDTVKPTYKPDAMMHGGPFNPNNVTNIDVNPDYKGSESLYWNYVDRASKLAKGKLYGRDYMPIVEKIKNMIGFKDDAHSNDASVQLEGRNHYPAFRDGPFHASVHQTLKEFTNPNTYDNPGNLTSYPPDPKLTNVEGKYNWDNVNAINDLFKNKGPGKFSNPNNQSVQFLNKYMEHMNSYLGSNGFKPIEYTDHGFAIDPKINELNHGQQLDLARNFGSSTQADPGFNTSYHNVLKNLSDIQRSPTVNYPNFLRTGATVLQDIPREVGYGMMAGGAALGGGYLLNKIIHHKNQSQKPKDILVDPNKPLP